MLQTSSQHLFILVGDKELKLAFVLVAQDLFALSKTISIDQWKQALYHILLLCGQTYSEEEITKDHIIV